MKVSQQLNHINENTYDDDITVTEVPIGHFLAIISNKLAEGASTREIQVDIMPLEQGPGGTRTTNTGLYRKVEEESAVHVVVTQDGKTLAENTQSYA